MYEWIELDMKHSYHLTRYVSEVIRTGRKMVDKLAIGDPQEHTLPITKSSTLIMARPLDHIF